MRSGCAKRTSDRCCNRLLYVSVRVQKKGVRAELLAPVFDVTRRRSRSGNGQGSSSGARVDAANLALSSPWRDFMLMRPVAWGCSSRWLRRLWAYPPVPRIRRSFIPSISSMTGAGAFSARKPKKRFRRLETASPARRHQRPSDHFEIYDDQSKPQVSVQLLSQIMAGGSQSFWGHSSPTHVLPSYRSWQNKIVQYCLSPGSIPRKARTASPRA